MPGLSKVIVLDPDARASRQVQLGFEREGVPTEVAAIPVDASRFELPASLEGDDPGLLVVGGADGRALELVRRARKLLDDHHADVPIVFAGRGVRRTDAEAAGADEVVLQPAFLRDVVTIGRLLRGQPATQRAHIVGSLAETTGVFTLVRALSALGRSAVLTLIRGLRRGEVRFYHGEVTSAQVGLIHGQAALHQLLLWTDARFDFHHEDVVRRQQIPLSHEELWADAERFLAGVRDSSGKLSPSMVLEQDLPRIQMFGTQIPLEVHGVLRMFDGHRVLADVLEDSPYRVFETLRVAQRALDVGLLRTTESPRPKATWRAVLAIEEWLVGAETRERVLERASTDSGPVPAAPRATGATEYSARPGKGGSRRKRKKRRANTPVAVTPALKADPSRPEIDWGALVPRVVGQEAGPLAGVVPAAHTSGEITLPTRDAPREKLEALMDTGARERMFSTELGLEPSVVWRAEDDPQAKHAPGEAEPEARPDPTAGADTPAVRAAEAQAIAASVSATEPVSTADLVKRLVEDDRSSPALPSPAPRTVETAAVVVAETASAAVILNDSIDVTTTAETARLVAVPIATVTEPIAVTPPEATAVVTGAPVELLDEPSDGVIRESIATAETAPSLRRPPPGQIPEDDRPEAATGELSVLTTQFTKQEPVVTEPSILVADLAAIHTAVSAVAATQAAAAATPDAATPAREAVVHEVRRDATTGAFSPVEEAFFKGGETAPVPRIAPSETFDDLDEGYQPVGFWDRLLGRKPPEKP